MRKYFILLLILLISVPVFALSTAPSEKKIDFTLNDLSEKPISLSSYQGKVVLLAFFRTGCPACQDEMPYLEQLYRKYKAKGFEILGINITDRLQDVKLFEKEYKLSFTIVLDKKGDIATQYGVRYIPRLYLIDRSGKIKFSAYYTPIDALEKEIKKVL